MEQITLSFNGHTYPATLEDSATAAAFAQLLQSKGGSMTIHMSEYGGWEKVGSLGQSLPSNNVQTTTAPGDFVLYSGNQIVLFYGSNSWSYTRLGRLDDPSGLQDALGSGDVEITFQLAGNGEDTGPFDLVSRRVTLNSGYDMPINGLGTYSLTGETCVTAVKSALDQGVRHPGPLLGGLHPGHLHPHHQRHAKGSSNKVAISLPRQYKNYAAKEGVPPGTPLLHMDQFGKTEFIIPPPYLLFQAKNLRDEIRHCRKSLLVFILAYPGGICTLLNGSNSNFPRMGQIWVRISGWSENGAEKSLKPYGFRDFLTQRQLAVWLRVRSGRCSP